MIEIKDTEGEVIYAGDFDDMKECVEQAVKDGVSLRGANLARHDLQYAYLQGANLQGASLQGTNLRDSYLVGVNLHRANLQAANLQCAILEEANLQYADLKKANLQDANLQGANLREAELEEANLQDVNLHDCIGNMREIKSMQIEQYVLAYTSKHLQIGCKRRELEEWWNLSDEEIDAMHSKALVFWHKWRDTIRNIIEMSPATGEKS